MDEADPTTLPRRRVRNLALAAAAVLVLLVLLVLLGFEVGLRTAHWESMSSASAPNTEDGRRVFQTRTAVVLGLDDRSTTRAIVDGIASWIEESAPSLAAERVVIGEEPFVPRAGKALPDLFVLVTVLEYGSTWLPFMNTNEMHLHLSIGRTPQRCMDLTESPFHDLLCELEIEGSATFWGLEGPWSQRAALLEEIREQWDSLMEDIEIEDPSSDPSGLELAALPSVAEPPFSLAGVTRSVYRGRRADGSYEAMWNIDTSGSCTRTVEELILEAESEGWERAGGHLSAEGRPVAVELVRDGERVQVLPARFEGNARENADAPDTLALIHRNER